MIAPFAEIVFGGPYARPLTALKRIVGAVELRVYPAIVTHLDHAKLVFAAKHRVG